MLQHKHLIVRAEVMQPPKNCSRIENWLKSLVNRLSMKIMMGPYVAYCEMPGNRGMTGVVIIETSHIALHSWDEENPGVIQLDVYTCSDLNPKIIWDALQEFEPVHIDYKFLNRENKFIRML